MREVDLEDGSVMIARAEPVAIPPDATIGEAFQSAGLAALRHFSQNGAGVAAHLGEAIHQMRVGLRRLRAAIAVFKPLLGDAETRALRSELKWLTEELGPARDFDVFLRDSTTLALEQHARKEELAALCAVLEQRRIEGLEKAARAVASERYQRLLDSLVLWLTAGAWVTTSDQLLRARRNEGVRSFARLVLGVRAHKLKKRLKRFAALDPEARHELRIFVKKLRYATEFFETTLGAKRKSRAFVRVLGELELQEALGHLNDGVVHRRIANRISAGEPLPSGEVPSRLAVFGAGFVCGREDAEAKVLVRQVRRARRELASTSRFWD
jgi:CHAD domain-containing protein